MLQLAMARTYLRRRVSCVVSQVSEDEDECFGTWNNYEPEEGARGGAIMAVRTGSRSSHDSVENTF